MPGRGHLLLFRPGGGKHCKVAVLAGEQGTAGPHHRKPEGGPEGEGEGWVHGTPGSEQTLGGGLVGMAQFKMSPLKVSGHGPLANEGIWGGGCSGLPTQYQNHSTTHYTSPLATLNFGMEGRQKGGEPGAPLPEGC